MPYRHKLSPAERLIRYTEKARTVHGDKYDYPHYHHSNEKMQIYCKKCDKYFLQRPAGHLQGNGCPICGKEKQYPPKDRLVLFNIFHAKAVIKFGNKYGYDKDSYISSEDYMTIICAIHGPYLQVPASHLRGIGCPRCNESKGERVVATILDNLNIKYTREYRIPGNRFYYDFYIPEHCIFIEFHGRQHFMFVDHFYKSYDDLLHRKFLDEAKEKLVRILGEEMIVLTYKHLESDTLEETLLEYLSRFNVID